MEFRYKIFQTWLFLLGILLVTALACGGSKTPPKITIRKHLPTLTPTSIATPVVPTDTPVPPAATAPPSGNIAPVATVGPKMIIKELNHAEEYVDIENVGSERQDLSGWNLFAPKSDKRCNLTGTLPPEQTLRIWALAAHADKGGYNCGFSQAVFNPAPSPAVLLDERGAEIFRKD